MLSMNDTNKRDEGFVYSIASGKIIISMVFYCLPIAVARFSQTKTRELFQFNHG